MSGRYYGYQIGSRTLLLTSLPIDTRVVVRGATTELDPAFFGRPPSIDTGSVVLSGTVTAGVEFDDGTRVFGIPWAVIEPVLTTAPERT